MKKLKYNELEIRMRLYVKHLFLYPPEAVYNLMFFMVEKIDNGMTSDKTLITITL